MDVIKMYQKDMQNLGKKKSAIRELFEYGNQKKQEIGEEYVYDFSIGNPSVPSPQIVTDTLQDLLTHMEKTHLHGYTPAAGDLEVRKSIANYLNETYHTHVEANKIYLTAGAAAALTIGFHAILSKGDEVIVFSPFFPEYRVFVEKTGAKLKTIASLEDTFLPDMEKFKASITKMTKIVLIDSPNNPTGVLFTETIIQNIANILKEKENEYGHPIYLMSDEPYRELIYDHQTYPFITNYYDDAIVCYSFSKSLSLPGERIGYILVSSTCVDAEGLFEAIHGAGRALGFVCAPSIFQYMIPSCLGHTADITIYKTNRDILYEALTSMGYQVTKPDGAFYLFVKALESDAKRFSQYAKEQYNLLLVPSDSFGCLGYVRISYCVNTDMIQRSIPIFFKLFEDYRKGVEHE